MPLRHHGFPRVRRTSVAFKNHLGPATSSIKEWEGRQYILSGPSKEQSLNYKKCLPSIPRVLEDARPPNLTAPRNENMPEQREHPRHPPPPVAPVSSNESFGQIANISLGGFSFKYPDMEAPIKTRGQDRYGPRPFHPETPRYP